MTTYHTNFRLFFHKVSLIINILFPPLHQTLFAGQVNISAEVSELFTHNVFQVFFIHKMVAKEGGQNYRSRRCLIRTAER